MKFAMVRPAQRNGEFIANFESKAPWLGESQMVWIGRIATAHQAGLRPHKSKMGFVSDALDLAERKQRLGACYNRPTSRSSCSLRGCLSDKPSVLFSGCVEPFGAKIARRPWNGRQVIGAKPRPI
jgi:hypothetical protein